MCLYGQPPLGIGVIVDFFQIVAGYALSVGGFEQCRFNAPSLFPVSFNCLLSFDRKLETFDTLPKGPPALWLWQTALIAGL